MEINKIRDNTIHYSMDKSVQWEIIARAAEESRDAGLKIMLFPIVLITDPHEDGWRGGIESLDRAA
jgi:hypothetical protein